MGIDAQGFENPFKLDPGDRRNVALEIARSASLGDLVAISAEVRRDGPLSDERLFDLFTVTVMRPKMEAKRVQ